MSQDQWTLSEQIFCDALDLPPEAREAYVQQRCLGDAALLEQVLALLRADAEAEQNGAFKPPPIAEILKAFDEDVDPWGNPLPSQVLDYVLESKLGEGGMGVVYQAIDNKLNCKVAIKFISNKKRAHPDSLTRFQREQAALGALDHANVVRARVVREWQGFELLVMDFVEGRTLAALVKEVGRLDPERACTLAKQIAEGLGHAHQHHVIHRDLKPLNLIVTPEGVVKILDFGVARLGNGDGEPAPLTESGVAVGTVGYMAPEVADGGEATIQSDLYSLGCVLSFMLTGKTPSHSRTTKRDPLVLPTQLNSLLNRLLAEDPNERFGTAGEASDALEAVLQDLKEPKTEQPGRTALFYSLLTVAIGVWLAPWLDLGDYLPFSPNACASLICFVVGGLALLGRLGRRQVGLAFACGLLAAIPFAPEHPRPISFPEFVESMHAALKGLDDHECQRRRFLDLTCLHQRAANDPTARDALAAAHRIMKRMRGTLRHCDFSIRRGHPAAARLCGSILPAGDLPQDAGPVA